MRRLERALTLVLLASFAPAAIARAQAPGVAGTRVLESFDDASAFRAVPSDGVRLDLRADAGVSGSSLRMDFDFQGHAGYAVARRAFALPPLPPWFAITLWVRGDARPNTLEIKLVDRSGQNVWWIRRPELAVTGAWTRLRFRSSDLAFAWGPLAGGPPRDIASLEIAFTAGAGGRGWLALDELTLVPLAAPVAASRRPTVTASSTAPATDPARIIGPAFASAPRHTPLAHTAWASAADGVQSLDLDFGGTRQLSALVLDWSDRDWPVDYDVEASPDGQQWSVLRTIRGSAGGRRFVHLPRTEAAHLRLTMRRSSRGRGYALGAVYLLADSAAATRSAFLERVADGSPPGWWPRSLVGEQSYWTVVGLPRDDRDALVDEDGRVESRPGGFSIEPFLLANGVLHTWRDGTTTQALDAGALPIPSVRRSTGDLSLTTTSFAAGTPGHSVVWIRYRVANGGARQRRVVLSAAVRPVQVNPPTQFLGVEGGAATVGRIVASRDSIVVNGTDRVLAVTRASSVRAARFDAGGVVGLLARPAGPGADSMETASIDDGTGFGEAALSWELALGAHASADVWIALPVPGAARGGADVPRAVHGANAARLGETALAQARALWDHELGTFHVSFPGDGAPIARTLRSALAYVLINANGPAIQPGTRSYRRSWIRDGALTSSAVMRLGHAADARAFLDWYVPHVFPDGKVPCCVDARGSDPVAENDADGELLYLAAEYFRLTHDTAAIVRHWPTLARVAAHLDSLRESRRTAAYRTPDSLLVFGLLPPSISHEGYSSKPAYSYWDDWWGVRGLDDAALLARLARDDTSATRYARAGRVMRRDVVASVARSMTRFGLQTLPGAAERGDLDPTSSTIALEPAQALADLPRHAVEATFDSAWATLQRRRAPGSAWDAFVPYEWRDVGAYLRLGEPERANDYSQWLMESRRPREWNQWSEVVWREPRAPRFIGDMPHGWVLSDFIRSTLDRVVYERERDSTLVVGAGIPYAWARDPAGVDVEGVRTWWGTVALTVRPAGSAIRVVLSGVAAPRGIELRAPFGRVPRAATVNGRSIALTGDGRAVMVGAPVVVEFLY